MSFLNELFINALYSRCSRYYKNIKGDKNNKIMVYFESSVDRIVLKAII